MDGFAFIRAHPFHDRCLPHLLSLTTYASQHTIGSSKRAQTFDPNQPPENSYEPLNLTLDLEYAHVSGRSRNAPRGSILSPKLH